MIPRPIVLATAEEALLTPHLTKAGWNTVSVADASLVLSAAIKSNAVALVVDANIPNGGGVVAARSLRSSAEAKSMGIVVLVTGGSQRREMLAAGADDCVERPAEPDSVLAALEKYRFRSIGDPSSALAESLRIAALRASGLMDSPASKAYDRVTKLAGILVGAPIALLSLVDAERQFFKSQIGLGEPWASKRQTPLSYSFCKWVVAGRSKVVITDARSHPTLQSNAAIKDMGVIAYAGVPVVASQGEVLGSLCAIDMKPKTWTAQDLDVLADLGRITEAVMAHDALQKSPPRRAEDLNRMAESSAEAIFASTRILRRQSLALGLEYINMVLEIIDESSQVLFQINRLIQVNQALS